MGLLCNYTVPMDCDTCYETTVNDPCTNTTFNFALGLVPGTVYFLFIVDKFLHAYRDSVTVKPDGSIDVTMANYPTGYFNEYAGVFKFYLTTDVAGLNKVDFSILAVTYNCIIFEIV